MLEVAKISVLVLAIITVLGGVMGFVKAQSKASLIAGSISGLALAACYFVAGTQTQAGLVGGLIIAGLLEGIFVKRLLKTKKFMPSGMMMVCCGICQIIVVLALVMHH
jgi:uncharacterized membrane protein (UPF0136 family)